MAMITTYAHDVIQNLMSDNLTDSTSLVTLQSFTEDLTVRVIPFTGINFYHGSNKGLSVYRSSDFQTDDRIVTLAGHMHLCSNSKALYRAFSAAVDAKLVVFEGMFDRPNRHVATGADASIQVTLRAETLVPYIFNEGSPLH